MNGTLEYFLNKFRVDANQPSPITVHYSRFKAISMIKELGFTCGAEIGTEHGFYAGKLCQANPQLKLYCVDPYVVIPYYEGYKDQEQVNVHYEAAKKRLAPYDCDILKMTSMEAVKRFYPNELDFVFIDGDHYFEYVVNDIIYWTKIVRPGGIVFGHDYSDQFHVKQAIHAYTDAYKIKPWFILNTKGLIDSWLFIKE